MRASQRESRDASLPAPPHERVPGGGDEERARLLAARIGDLGLRVEGSRLEPLVAELHRELSAAGLVFKPRVYLSDEWGCPDGVPLIGVPFYLVDERLWALQKELLDDIETETDAEILAYLRHEAGHAFNLAQDSEFPMAARAAGYEYKQVIERILESALAH